MENKNLEKLKQKQLEQLEKVTKNRSEKLIEEIKIAFADNSYPKNKYVSGSAKHNLECEEHRESHKFFVGKTWQEVLDEKSYRKLCGGQSYFNSWAWRYYLPAYLIQSIRHQKFSSFSFNRSKSKDEYDKKCVSINDSQNSRFCQKPSGQVRMPEKKQKQSR